MLRRSQISVKTKTRPMLTVLKESDYVIDKTKYDVTFTITDGSTPVENARIVLGGREKFTSALGVAVFRLVAGTFTYQITHASYDTVTDTVTVTGTQAVPVDYLPSASDLNTLHTTISGTDYIDSINSLNAKLEPLCNVFNGTNDIATRSITLNSYLPSATSGSIKALIKYTSGQDMQIFNSSAILTVAKYLYVSILSNKLIVYSRGTANIAVNTVETISSGWHEIEVSSDGTAYTFLVDGTPLTPNVLAGSNNGAWFANAIDRVNISIGAFKRNTITYGRGIVSWVKVDDGVNGYWIANNNQYIYDVSGNNLHLSISGSGVKLIGDTGADNYLKTNGYSLYAKRESISIQVPMLSSGTAIISPDVPTGYAKIDDITSGEGSDMMVNFDPLSGANAKIDTFDKANATIHIATASMSYYNASLPYTWTLMELFDPLIYFSYFNNGHRGKVFSKITSKEVSGYHYPITHIQQLNYATDKTGSDEWAIINYCGIDDFVEVDVDGNPLYDENDYVVLKE